MLQIVVWMLCVYLLVKGFEILSNPVQRNALGIIGAAIAWLAAPIFFVLSVAQSNSFSDNLTAPTALPQGRSFRDCLNDPNTTSCNYDESH